MALSNKFGWLVLTTGNKSEMAVGYATLYGDMAGGFAVLKDVPKTLVYRLAAYRNSLGPGGGPHPAVHHRPGSVGRACRRPDRPGHAAAVRPPRPDHRGLRGRRRQRGRDRGLGHRPDARSQRVVAMIDGNEYKRRQAAPGVRITPKAFGKDRRLPITNRYRG